MSDLYQVMVDGTLEPGIDRALAAKNFQALFKVKDEQLKVIFSGKKVAIKRQLDKAGAKKYQVAIKRTGLRCTIEPNPQSVKAASAEQSAAKQGAVKPKPIQAEPQAKRKPPAVAQPRDDSPKKPKNFRLAPTGARVSPIAKPPPAAPDVSHISLSEQAPFDEMQSTPTPAAPDTSDLSVEALGVNLGKEKVDQTLDINLDHLVLDEVGATMDQSAKQVSVSVPDTSHLDLQKNQP